MNKAYITRCSKSVSNLGKETQWEEKIPREGKLDIPLPLLGVAQKPQAKQT